MAGRNDPYKLQRFVDAQDPIYEQICSELRSGHKRGHWMWFVFPQLKGLGYSMMASTYGIASREEAAAYLQHSTLGPRLLECTGFLNALEGRSISSILGTPDDLKFRSSMTLFGLVATDASAFNSALQKYFDGNPDERTVAMLQV